jgi:nitrite reductase/ring-hydroxylating ferredoxin subunit
VDQLPPGGLRRVSYGDLDVLLAYTSIGIFSTDDRCPHQAAPFSVGHLDDCILECPLHRGRFDLVSGDPVQMPTTGGLDPDSVYHDPWSRSGAVKVDPPGEKTDARRLTRTRRLRYYPVRIVDGMIEVAVPT